MTARAYYNEWDKYAAAWLRNLIAEGLIADGDVDERSIAEVTGTDLAGYTQVHLFAGIGGWSRALRLAGVRDSRPVWTGSCPCQPFSAAGKRKGTEDERHLWPEMFRLIRECRPVRVFGEQVEGAVGHGWLDGVFSDLEAEAYTCGAVVLGAHSVGAPHIRQRLWWVADASQCGWRGRTGADGGDGAETGNGGGVGNACDQGPQGHGELGRLTVQKEWEGKKRHASTPGFWHNATLIPCLDGKTRRLEPGIAPLVDGVSARVGKLRAYGNAIVPEVAAEFILACEECLR